MGGVAEDTVWATGDALLVEQRVETFFELMNSGNVLPTFGNFALHLGITRKRLFDTGDKLIEPFRDIVQYGISRIQASLEQGLLEAKNFNTTGIRYILVNSNDNWDGRWVEAHEGIKEGGDGHEVWLERMTKMVKDRGIRGAHG